MDVSSDGAGPRTAATDLQQTDTKARLALAERLCLDRGVQFTQARRQLLEILWDLRRPVRAYELIEILQKASGRRVRPPTVYRGLTFLLEQRFIARIESINAFVVLESPDHQHTRYFLLCGQCGTSIEGDANALADILASEAAAANFEMERQCLEVAGTCSNCNVQRR